MRMVEKRFTSTLICLILCTLLLASCNKDYRVEYPKELTVAYCMEHYVEADPNLIFLQAAENSLGRGQRPGEYIHYHALRDVPVSSYLGAKLTHLLGYYTPVILKHKNVTEHAIWDCTITKAELYWRRGQRGNDAPYFKDYGTGIYFEPAGEWDVSAFKTCLTESLANADYLKGIETNGLNFVSKYVEDTSPKFDALLFIRVHFAEYEGLVWDSLLYRDGAGAVYMTYYAPNAEEGYDKMYIPLSAELSAKLPA